MDLHFLAQYLSTSYSGSRAHGFQLRSSRNKRRGPAVGKGLELP